MTNSIPPIRLPMPLISCQKQCTMKIEQFCYRFGILLGRRDLGVSFQSILRDSSVAVIVYDVANRQSFLNTAKRIEEVRTERGTDVIIVLVGSKTDLIDKRQISIEEGDGKAREFGVMFMETGAKDGFNILPLFQKIVAASHSREIKTLLSRKQEDAVDVEKIMVSDAAQKEDMEVEDDGLSYMLKKMEETFDAKLSRVEERIRVVEGLVERGRLEMFNKLAEMQKDIFRRLDELQSHKE